MQPYGGCLCTGCFGDRIGRKLMPIDFPADAPLNNLPGTARLMRAKGRPLELGEFPEDEWHSMGWRHDYRPGRENLG